MKVLLKGVQTGEDAVLAAERGLDGIICSNHGGRQMDFSRSGVEVLAEVMSALKARGLHGKLEVLVDGGIRRGSDVMKALALGASAVGIGRPSLYGMASYGQAGVEKVLQILKDEMIMGNRPRPRPPTRHAHAHSPAARTPLESMCRAAEHPSSPVASDAVHPPCGPVQGCAWWARRTLQRSPPT